MTNQPIADVVGLFIFIAALIFSNEVANIVGPYMVVLLASSIGASFALARRDPDKRGRALWFFTRVNGIAVLLTVILAAGVSTYRPEWSQRLLVAPIALLVGFVGDDWPKLLSKVMRVVYGALDLMRGGGKGGAP